MYPLILRHLILHAPLPLCLSTPCTSAGVLLPPGPLWLSHFLPICTIMPAVATFESLYPDPICLPPLSATVPLRQITHKIFQEILRSFGQHLYTLYGTPLGPVADLALATATTSWASGWAQRCWKGQWGMVCRTGLWEALALALCQCSSGCCAGNGLLLP